MKWKPASQMNEVCDQNLKLNIKYGHFIYTLVDSPPSFPGSKTVGDLTSFDNYINKNIIYPKMAKQNNIKGVVFVSFIVNKRGGNVQDKVEVIKGLGFGLDEEAIRIIKNSPLWIPGSQRENPVYCRMVIPVRFKD